MLEWVLKWDWKHFDASANGPNSIPRPCEFLNLPLFYDTLCDVIQCLLKCKATSLHFLLLKLVADFFLLAKKQAETHESCQIAMFHILCSMVIILNLFVLAIKWPFATKGILNIGAEHVL